MEGVALMKRTDTKFVIHTDHLNGILSPLQQDYRILEINGKRLMSYTSAYFDTIKHRFYKEHHIGRKVRAKVRVRTYIDSQVQFIEVKQKNNKGQTIKSRIKTDGQNLVENTNSYANQLLNLGEQLQKTISNDFKRVTLVHKQAKERVTIDTKIRFNEQFWDPNLVVIELKQEQLKRNSPLFQTLKAFQIHPSRISKYCLGMSTAYPHLRTNNFKPLFRNIRKTLAKL